MLEGTELALAGDRQRGHHETDHGYEDGKELHYRIEDGSLKRLELLEGETVVQWVEVELDGDSKYPVLATYRNLAAFRELKIIRDRLDRVESYPPDIWNPLGERGR